MTIKTKIASVAVAAAMVFSASAANAAVYTIVFTDGLGSQAVTNSGGAAAGTIANPNRKFSAFTDTFLFTIPYKSIVSAYLTSSGANAARTNVNFGPLAAVVANPYTAPAVTGTPTYGLNSGGPRTALTVNNTGLLENRSFSNVLLGAGTYSVIVPGVSQRLGTYDLTVSFTTVPEPAAWAMMILGLGATGAALRVRRRKVSFAA